MGKLGEYCKVISGFAFKSQDLSEGTDIPVIKIGNISNGKGVILDDSTQYVSKDFLSIDDKYHVTKGDILISLTGSHINQPNSMVGRSCRNFSDTEFLLNQRAGKVIPNQKADKDYLYYLLNTKSFKYSICNRAYGAANQANVSPSDIEDIKWDFPSLSTQKKIASILSAYDNLIENNNKRIKILEQMAESLYKEWFVRFRFPGHGITPIENGIPKGWKRDCINKFYTTSSGGTPSREKQEFYEDGTIPWVKTGEIVDSIIQKTEEKITEEAVKKSSAKMIPSGSLLMAMYGVNIGKLGITSIEMTCNQAACVFKDLGAKSSAHYLFHYLKSIREYLLSISFGAAQQNLSQELIKKIKIVMPSKTILEKFEDFVSSYYDEISALQNQNDNLIKRRDLLLPRLMSGKLAV